MIPENFEEMQFGPDPGYKCSICEEQKKNKAKLELEDSVEFIDEATPASGIAIVGVAVVFFWVGLAIGFFIWCLR